MSANKVVALVLAGGYSDGFGVLTLNRAKAAVTIAGNYRVIDFALSNLTRARIEQIGIIIQYLPSSLIEHVGVGEPWDLHGYGRLLKILPPFVGRGKTEWYKGTADALFQNINTVDDMQPDHIVVCSGEHAYHLDFEAVLKQHIERDADLTMVATNLPQERRSNRFGFVVPTGEGKSARFYEKPDAPPPNGLVSTGIAVFRAEVLKRLLHENALEDTHNLAKDILEARGGEFRTEFFETTEPWAYLENLGGYYEVHRAFLDGRLNDTLDAWDTVTNLEYRGQGFASPALFAQGGGATQSLVGAGCMVAGRVKNSVLSPGVRVGSGAVVRNSILMHGCVVDAGAVVENTIADRDSIFGANCQCGTERAEGPRDHLDLLGATNLLVLGKGTRVGAGVVLGRDRQIPPGTQVNDTRVAARTYAELLEDSKSPFAIRARA